MLLCEVYKAFNSVATWCLAGKTARTKEALLVGSVVKPCHEYLIFCRHDLGTCCDDVFAHCKRWLVILLVLRLSGGTPRMHVRRNTSCGEPEPPVPRPERKARPEPIFIVRPHETLLSRRSARQHVHNIITEGKRRQQHHR